MKSLALVVMTSFEQILATILCLEGREMTRFTAIRVKTLSRVALGSILCMAAKMPTRFMATKVKIVFMEILVTI